MKRGAFESIAPTSQVARPSMSSTIRPEDYGRGLRSIADGLEKVAELMGKMSNFADKAYAVKQANEGNLAKHNKQKKELMDEYSTYADKNSPEARACYKNIERINQEIAYDRNVLKRSNIFGMWGTATDGTK